MTWQTSNWLVGIFGSFATLVAVIMVLAIIGWIGSYCYWQWPNRHVSLPTLYFGVLWRLALGLVLVMALFTFSSNSPKVTLEPDYAAEQEASQQQLSKPTEPINDLSPEQLTPEQRSAKLEALREQQKQQTENE
ncbi:hypothetical protein GCM10011369_03360 [Neiella marina]|uniref:Uncharacterized protein n=1 Tax=Neiella marina TaxID=508461 RepID=A0A8J2U243_9GAMM|nr:hypothetical protein [Neiella marina]GGA65246.1 hypothetical protein GCM10011369_03360 [Neiella marina]